MKRGNMAVADAALWFGRPYTTVRSWLVHERVPSPGTPPGREAHRLLDLLEAAIARDTRFPIPAHLTQRYRKTYVKELVRRHVKRDPVVPAAHPAA